MSRRAVVLLVAVASAALAIQPNNTIAWPHRFRERRCQNHPRDAVHDDTENDHAKTAAPALPEAAKGAVVPDTSKAKPLGRWPNDSDLERLARCEGKTPAEVIQILGHPSRIFTSPKGRKTWDYPWQAACRIWFENGTVVSTYYTAGY